MDRHWLLLSIVTFFIGFGLGYHLSYFSLSVFLGIITSGIGTGAVLLAFLKAWFKEIVIEFGKVTVDAGRGYFPRVQQKGEKVKGKAKSAEGHLTLENTPY